MGDGSAALGPLSKLVPQGGGPKPPKLVTKAEYDRIVAGLPPAGGGIMGGARDAVLSGYQVLPPPAPDLADETVQRARQAARRRILMGGLTGPLDLSGASVAKPPPGLGGA